MGELDEMMTAPTSLVPQQEQQRMQAPMLGYANPIPYAICSGQDTYVCFSFRLTRQSIV